MSTNSIIGDTKRKEEKYMMNLKGKVEELYGKATLDLINSVGKTQPNGHTCSR